MEINILIIAIIIIALLMMLYVIAYYYALEKFMSVKCRNCDYIKSASHFAQDSREWQRVKIDAIMISTQLYQSSISDPSFLMKRMMKSIQQLRERNT